MKTHLHHIIPKHAGGTDHPDNLIELTIEEHAEAHKELFIKYRRWQDEVAYLVLSHKINFDEADRIAVAQGRAEYWTPEKRKEFGDKRRGIPLTEKHSKAISKSLIGNDYGKYSAGVPRHYLNGHPFQNKKRPDHSAHMKALGIVPPNATGKSWKQETLTCPSCGKTGGGSNMKRYHFDKCKVA